MTNDQIVRSRRTLHRDPTPAEYGIRLEKAAPEAAPAEKKKEQRQTAPGDEKQSHRQGSLNDPREKLGRPQGELDPTQTQDPGSGAGSIEQKEMQKGRQKEEHKKLQKSLQEEKENAKQENQKEKKENKHPVLSFLIKACLALCALYLLYHILVAAQILRRSGSTGSTGSSGSGGSGSVVTTSTQDQDTGDSGEESGGLGQGTSGTGDETENAEAETGGQSSGLLQGTAENTGSVQTAQTASPDAAYTEIVRSYASYLEQDSQAFIDAYDAGRYGSATSTVSGSDINYELIYSYFSIPDYTEMHYAVRDYNEDGVQELLILLSSDGGSYPQIWAGYTFDGTKVVPLFTGDCRLGYRIDLYTLPDNAFLIHGGGGALSGDDTICRIAEDRSGLVIQDSYEYDEQTYGSRDHFGTYETLTDAEFQSEYYDVMMSATDGLSLQSVSSSASVTTQ